MQYEGHIAGGVVVFDDKAELPEGTQVVVVPVVRNQAPPTNLPVPKSRPPGAPPESLLRMAGFIPIADCVEMEQAIEELSRDRSACG